MINQDVKCPAISHGIKFEAVAVEHFEEQTGLVVPECGIYVSQEHPFLDFHLTEF